MNINGLENGSNYVGEQKASSSTNTINMKIETAEFRNRIIYLRLKMKIYEKDINCCQEVFMHGKIIRNKDLFIFNKKEKNIWSKFIECDIDNIQPENIGLNDSEFIFIESINIFFTKTHIYDILNIQQIRGYCYLCYNKRSDCFRGFYRTYEDWSNGAQEWFMEREELKTSQSYNWL